MRNEWMQGGREGGRVQRLQNQNERHVERLIFLFLISQSPAAWRLGGPGDEEMGWEWQRAGDPGPEWQVGMVCEALGFALSQARLVGRKTPGR